MTHPSLKHFIEAQDPVYDRVVGELADGDKRTHWMWFIFPQIEGLGRSPTAMRYAIPDLDHARRYLDDPVLGERLRQCTRLMLTHANSSAHAILGSPDDLKFRSCLTLFLKAAGGEEDRELFAQALDQFYGGEPDPRTLELIEHQ